MTTIGRQKLLRSHEPIISQAKCAVSIYEFAQREMWTQNKCDPFGSDATKDPLPLKALSGVRVRAPTLSLGPANRVRLITRRLWTDVLTSDVTPSVRECFYTRDGCVPSNAETDVRTSDGCSQPSSDKTDPERASEAQSGSSDISRPSYPLGILPHIHSAQFSVGDLFPRPQSPFHLDLRV